jgi:hypothetical protein
VKLVCVCVDGTVGKFRDGRDKNTKTESPFSEIKQKLEKRNSVTNLACRKRKTRA